MTPTSTLTRGCIFTVREKPYAAWAADGTNEEFLRGIDANYFSYVAETHAAQLEGEHKQRAATALRIAYHHGLETLFMLIFATLQAPNCVIGWLLKCWPVDIRELIVGVESGQLPRTSKLKLQTVSWESISALINGKLFAEREDSETLQKCFAGLWRKLASEYTDDYLDKEYNSFKHGFRARITGEPGPSISWTPSGANEPVVLSSEFGTSFFVPEELTEAKDPRLDHHFKLNSYYVDLQPRVMVSALCLIAMSITNVVAFLRLVNGPPTEGVQVVRPENKQDFDIFSQRFHGGLLKVAISPRIRESVIRPFSKEEIVRRLTQPKAKGTSSAK